MKSQAQQDFLDRRQLVSALRSLRRGDFTVRLPEDSASMDQDIAVLFNEVVSLNQQITQEFERLSQVVGKEGKIGQRARVRGASGGWETKLRAINELIEAITMLSVILTGAALIREREHGTIEHLLVMPVTAFEIMVGKLWSMGLVVLAASAFCLIFVVQGLLAVPINGSLTLFLAGAALDIFAMTCLGMFLATVAGSMPQFALLVMMVLMPLQLLSGGITPRENMPEIIQAIMFAAPNTHFVMLAQAVLFRGADLAIVWPQLVALLVIGIALFAFSLRRFRQFLG